MFEPNEAYHTEGFELAPAGASAADAGIAGRLVARRDRRAFAGRTAGFGTRVARIFLRHCVRRRARRHAIRAENDCAFLRKKESLR
jgi:hypothetical protein